MGTYCCARCGYETAIFGNLKKHLQRKNPCRAARGDVSVEAAWAKAMEMHRGGDAGEAGEAGEAGAARPRFECQDCGARFTMQPALSRHRRRTCKHRGVPDVLSEIIKTQDALRKENDDLRKKLAELDQKAAPVVTHSHQTNCNNTHNIQINLNAFGQESTEHLTHAFLDRCIRRTNKGLIDLIEKLHFDPDVPPNHNIRITNKKLPLAEYNDGEKWCYQNRNTLLEAVLDKGHNILQEHLDDNEPEIRSTMSETMAEYILEWMQKVAEKEKTTWEHVLTDAFVLVLNKSRAAHASTGHPEEAA